MWEKHCGSLIGKVLVESARDSYKKNCYLITVTAFFMSQKQPPRGVLKKRCSKNMQQIYRRTPMLTCDFNKVALR